MAIVEQDLINAAGNRQALAEAFAASDVELADLDTDPGYQERLAFALEEAQAVLHETQGITFSLSAMEALPRAQVLPLILLASRYAVLNARLRGAGRVEDVEGDERAEIRERLSRIAQGFAWPGLTRPDASTNIKQGFRARDRVLRVPGFLG